MLILWSLQVGGFLLLVLPLWGKKGSKLPWLAPPIWAILPLPFFSWFFLLNFLSYAFSFLTCQYTPVHGCLHPPPSFSFYINSFPTSYTTAVLKQQGNRLILVSIFFFPQEERWLATAFLQQKDVKARCSTKEKHFILKISLMARMKNLQEKKLVRGDSIKIIH